MQTIDRDTYLKGLALYTLAQDYYAKLRECERALVSHLGCGEGGDDLYGGTISDDLYAEPQVSFDRAIERAGYTVNKEAAQSAE